MVQLTQGLLGISLRKDEFNNLKLFESFGVLFLKGIKVFLAQKATFYKITDYCQNFIGNIS